MFFFSFFSFKFLSSLYIVYSNNIEKTIIHLFFPLIINKKTKLWYIPDPQQTPIGWYPVPMSMKALPCLHWVLQHDWSHNESIAKYFPVVLYYKMYILWRGGIQISYICLVSLNMFDINDTYIWYNQWYL